MNDYEVAQKHYLRSNDPEGFAGMLVQWADEVYPSEQDLLVARAVLMYLCLQNLKDANIIYSLFKNRYTTLDTPLFNYTRFLLLTLERDALPLFDLLRNTYQKSLQRDPTFTQVHYCDGALITAANNCYSTWTRSPTYSLEFRYQATMQAWADCWAL
jgi:hypothetical protein